MTKTFCDGCGHEIIKNLFDKKRYANIQIVVHEKYVNGITGDSSCNLEFCDSCIDKILSILPSSQGAKNECCKS